MKQKNIFIYKFLFILCFIFFILFSLFENNVYASGEWTLKFTYDNLDYSFNLNDEFLNIYKPYDGNNKEGHFFIVANNDGSINKILMYQIYRMNNYFTCSLNGDDLTIHPENNDCLLSYKYSDKLIWDRALKDGFSYNINNCKIIFSTCDIKYTNGDIYFSGCKSVPFNITLSTTEKTDNPIIAYSNYFAYEDAFKYECYISSDSQNWKLMNYETLKDTNTNITRFRFNYTILENGNYFFKFLNKETSEEYYLSIKVTNIIKNSSNSGFTSSGIPQPFVTYERIGEYFVLKTQSFTKEEIVKYKCLYTNSFSEDYSSWGNMSIGSLKNTQLGQTEYFFFINVPKNSEDCTYFFVFYDYTKQEYGNFSSLECKFDKMNEYSDKVAGVIKEEKSRFDKLLDFFKERFGFLTYPFEFIVDLLTRILNIDYSEPIIHIPEMYCPGTDIKIFDGYDYNFNTLLEDEILSNVYNIYLIAVDFVIVIGVVFLAKNTLMEVLGNG